MASLPAHASWQQSSRPENTSSAPIETKPASQPESASQSFALNAPHTTEFPRSSGAQDTPSFSQEIPVHAPSTATEVRRCWICQEDSNDDTPGREWRTPCPCSLTAHDDCLIEWITSEEAPKPGEIGVAKEIVCPVCKAPIKIERPRDIIVLAAGKVQAAAKVLIFPTALSAVLGCFYSGLLVYGVNTIHIVFGPEDAARMMMPSRDLGFLTRHVEEAQRLISYAIRDFVPFRPSSPDIRNWKLFLGLPLIGPTLVLARTTLIDQPLALIPIIYLGLQFPSQVILKEWPPSPSLTFAILPYVRSLYNEAYKHAFGNLERKWDLAVQRKPREGETQEQVEEELNRADNNALFDLEVELRAGLDEEDERIEAEVPAAQPIIGEGGHLAQPAQDAPPPARRVGRDRRNWSTTSIGSTVMGALFFPMISSTMGDLLKLTFPARWVGKGFEGKGLLHEKWGRTVIGGCLFVVLKDAIVLYCKWRKAKDFGKKRVMDYVGKRTAGVQAQLPPPAVAT